MLVSLEGIIYVWRLLFQFHSCRMLFEWCGLRLRYLECIILARLMFCEFKAIGFAALCSASTVWCFFCEMFLETLVVSWSFQCVNPISPQGLMHPEAFPKAPPLVFCPTEWAHNLWPLWPIAWSRSPGDMDFFWEKNEAKKEPKRDESNRRKEAGSKNSRNYIDVRSTFDKARPRKNYFI